MRLPAFKATVTVFMLWKRSCHGFFKNNTTHCNSSLLAFVITTHCIKGLTTCSCRRERRRGSCDAIPVSGLVEAKQPTNFLNQPTFFSSDRRLPSAVRRRTNIALDVRPLGVTHTRHDLGDSPTFASAERSTHSPGRTHADTSPNPTRNIFGSYSSTTGQETRERLIAFRRSTPSVHGKANMPLARRLVAVK